MINIGGKPYKPKPTKKPTFYSTLSHSTIKSTVVSTARPTVTIPSTTTRYITNNYHATRNFSNMIICHMNTKQFQYEYWNCFSSYAVSKSIWKFLIKYIRWKFIIFHPFKHWHIIWHTKKYEIISVFLVFPRFTGILQLKTWSRQYVRYGWVFSLCIYATGGMFDVSTVVCRNVTPSFLHCEREQSTHPFTNAFNRTDTFVTERDFFSFENIFTFYKNCTRINLKQWTICWYLYTSYMHIYRG